MSGIEFSGSAHDSFIAFCMMQSAGLEDDTPPEPEVRDTVENRMLLTARLTARREALRPRCPHGVLRATAQFGDEGFAGPVGECECCRSRFGWLGVAPDPMRCPAC
jgi:hypothetical protein